MKVELNNEVETTGAKTDDARTNGNLAMTLGYLASLARKILLPIGIVHNHIYNDPNQ